MEICDPIPGGIDKFPSTAGFSLELASDPGIRYNVRASSAGLPDAVVQREDQVGDTIDTELVSLSLQGNVPGLGRISIAESPTLVSSGKIENVVQEPFPDCGFVEGDSSFDILVEITLEDLGLTLVHRETDPLPLQAKIFSLPPTFRVYLPPSQPLRIPLFDKDSGLLVAYLLHAAHNVEPPPLVEFKDIRYRAEVDLEDADGNPVESLIVNGLVSFATVVGAAGPLRVTAFSAESNPSDVLGGVMTGALSPSTQAGAGQRDAAGNVRFDLPAILTLPNGVQAPVKFKFAGRIPINDNVVGDFDFDIIEPVPIGPPIGPPIIIIRRHRVFPPPPCPPIPAGDDIFPSTAGFSLMFPSTVVPGPQNGEVNHVRLSSAGLPDAIVRRQEQVGDTIETELISLSLRGNVSGLGLISVIESPTRASNGRIENVKQRPSPDCSFAEGDSFFGVFVEITLENQGLTLVHQDPIPLQAKIFNLPPTLRVYIPPSRPIRIPLFDKVTGNLVAYLLHAAHIIEPELPPPPDDGCEVIGDVSGDGTITAFDAALILQFVVGLIDHFPADDFASPPHITPRDYTLSVAEAAAKVGQRVTVPVSIADATGLTAGGIRLTYDSRALKAVNVTPTLKLNGSYWEANISLQGELRLAFVTTKPSTGGGTLFDVEFEVLPATEGQVNPLILESVELAGSKEIHKVDGSITILPSWSLLLQNYPNPFNPETWIPYQLAEQSVVTLEIYGASGQLVRILQLGEQTAGTYLSRSTAAYWDGRNLAGEPVTSGVYFYVLKTDSFSQVKKMAILK